MLRYFFRLLAKSNAPTGTSNAGVDKALLNVLLWTAAVASIVKINQ